MDESLPHALLELWDLVDLQFKDFMVVGGEEAVDVFLEGDAL